jgi:hypothetical protein
MKLDQAIVVGALALATEVAAAPNPLVAQTDEAGPTSQNAAAFVVRDSVKKAEKSKSTEAL